MPESNPKSDVRQALAVYAGRILSARPYFRAQLQNKLFQRAEKLGFADPESTISSIIDDLSASGYLNDKYLTEAYIRRQLAKGYGPKIISLKLRHLGLDRDTISSALKQEASAEAEMASIRKYLLKYRHLEPRKIASKLYSRGYSGHLIRMAFDGEWLED